MSKHTNPAEDMSARIDPFRDKKGYVGPVPKGKSIEEIRQEEATRKAKAIAAEEISKIAIKQTEEAINKAFEVAELREQENERLVKDDQLIKASHYGQNRNKQDGAAA